LPLFLQRIDNDGEKPEKEGLEAPGEEAVSRRESGRGTLDPAKKKKISNI
jgi:hypothetical protein